MKWAREEVAEQQALRVEMTIEGQKLGKPAQELEGTELEEGEVMVQPPVRAFERVNGMHMAAWVLSSTLACSPL